MTIPKKIIKIWDKELKEYGMMASAEEMGLNYRTINRAIKTGECTQKTFDTINIYLLRKRESNKELMEKVEKQIA